METGTQTEKEKKLETEKTGMQKFLRKWGALMILTAFAVIILLINYLKK